MTFKPDEPYRVPPISKKNLKDIQASLAKEITDAQVAVAQIKGFLEGLPESSSALMNPIFLKEAVESSEIENINTTLLEVLQRQVAPDIQEKSSSQLVVNYLIAMMWGMENVNKLGMTSRLIRGIQHQLLPTGAEGYRRLPVVIGDGKGKVHYSPPNAADIPELIGEWEELVNDNPSIDPLVLAAAAHYQFEAIHPFEDGNGRTGRTYKHQIREKFGNIYSHELLEAIFARAVQTPVQLAKDINIHYVTASKYLKVLEGEGYLRVVKLGRHTYYINQLLLELIEEKAPMTTDQEKKQDYKEVEA
jgi:Fic family protein